MSMFGRETLSLTCHTASWARARDRVAGASFPAACAPGAGPLLGERLAEVLADFA